MQSVNYKKLKEDEHGKINWNDKGFFTPDFWSHSCRIKIKEE